MGFHLVKRRWGNGFATEAALGVLQYAWKKSGGMHVVLQFGEHFDELAVSEAATAENLPVRSLSQYYQQKHRRQGIVLGFGAVSNQYVPALVERLYQLTNEVKEAAFAPVARILR